MLTASISPPNSASASAAASCVRAAAEGADGARRLARGGIAAGSALLYGGLALGILAGVGLTTYLWRQRAHGDTILSGSPLERAEQLIGSCENKLASIEEAVAELRAGR